MIFSSIFFFLFLDKVRRQPKPVKPKKIAKVEGQYIVDAACNNGSTALVTKEGSLLMFGKDTLHSDPVSGIINDLRDVCVVHVSLGKAHAAALTNKGHLYTFGINNKGQCGRDFTTVHSTINKDTSSVAVEMGTAEDELLVTEEGNCIYIYIILIFFHIIKKKKIFFSYILRWYGIYRRLGRNKRYVSAWITSMEASCLYGLHSMPRMYWI